MLYDLTCIRWRLAGLTKLLHFHFNLFQLWIVMLHEFHDLLDETNIISRKFKWSHKSLEEILSDCCVVFFRNGIFKPKHQLAALFCVHLCSRADQKHTEFERQFCRSPVLFFNCIFVYDDPCVSTTGNMNICLFINHNRPPLYYNDSGVGCFFSRCHNNLVWKVKEAIN